MSGYRLPSQVEFNALVYAARVEMESKRMAALQELAALMYARGYRAEELIIFHHEGALQAVAVGGDGASAPEWAVTDSTRIYLGARSPVWEYRLWMRRLWRRMRPYRDPRLDRIERREFPL